MDETKSLQLGAVLIQPLSNSITGLSERCCTQIPKSLLKKIKRKVAAVMFTTGFIWSIVQVSNSELKKLHLWCILYSNKEGLKIASNLAFHFFFQVICFLQKLVPSFVRSLCFINVCFFRQPWNCKGYIYSLQADCPWRTMVVVLRIERFPLRERMKAGWKSNH